MNVLLTYNIPGAIVAKGIYDNHNGRTLKRPEYSDCKVHTVLSDLFCVFAASVKSRPHMEENYDAYAHWNRMSPLDRIKYHVLSYVRAQEGFHPEFEIV